MNVVRALPRPERPTLDHAQRARLTSELQELSGAAVTTSGDDRWPTAFGAERLLFGSQFLCLPGLLPGRHVTVRLEGINGVGSIKGRAAYAMVRSLEITGMLRPGGHVVESSSGNLGVALAALCCQRGYRFTCVTDPNTSSHVTDLIEAYGSTVVQVHERDENGGYLATRLRTVQTVLAGDPLAVWPNQYGNEANLLAHEATTAPEIAAGVPHLSVLAVGAGTTGTLGGCTRWFRRHRPDVAVIAIDSVGSVTFGGPPSPRRIPGLGTSSRPPIADNATPHHIHHVAEIDGVRMCHHVRDRFGVMVGGSTGSVLAGVHQLGRLWALGTTVVAIGPDMGEKYLSSVYDEGWVTRHLGGAPRPASHRPDARPATERPAARSA